VIAHRHAIGSLSARAVLPRDLAGSCTVSYLYRYAEQEGLIAVSLARRAGIAKRVGP
jgi:hypothetical protein